MTNPEYVNPGIVQNDDDKRAAFDAQQEVAKRNPLNAVPDIITNAEADKAADEARAKVKAEAQKSGTASTPAKRTATPKA